MNDRKVARPDTGSLNRFNLRDPAARVGVTHFRVNARQSSSSARYQSAIGSKVLSTLARKTFL